MTTSRETISTTKSASFLSRSSHQNCYHSSTHTHHTSRSQTRDNHANKHSRRPQQRQWPITDDVHVIRKISFEYLSPNKRPLIFLNARQKDGNASLLLSFHLCLSVSLQLQEHKPTTEHASHILNSQLSSDSETQ